MRRFAFSLIAIASLGSISKAAPVGTYLFDEPDGSQTLTDSSGNGNNGFLGTSGSADAQDPSRSNTSFFNNGRSLQFGNGQSATIAPTGGDPFGFGTNAFTAEAWIRPTDKSGVQRLFSYGDQWVFRLEGANLRGYFNGTNTGDIFSAHPFKTNAWQHVAMTYTGAAGTNKLQIYINGELDKELTPSGSPSVNGPGNPNVTLSSAGESFRGLMDEARISAGVVAPASLGASHTLSGSPDNRPVRFTGGHYNLTPNGGFETEEPTDTDTYNAANWTGDGDFFYRSVDGPINGSRLLAVTERTNNNSGGVASNDHITGLTPGAQYVLSGFILRDGPGIARLDLGDAPEDRVAGFEDALTAPNNGQWTFVSATFTALGADRDARVIVDGPADLAGATSRYLFDDIAVTPLADFVAPTAVPEPGMISLAATVFAAGLMKRRRA